MRFGTKQLNLEPAAAQRKSKHTGSQGHAVWGMVVMVGVVVGEVLRNRFLEISGVESQTTGKIFKLLRTNSTNKMRIKKCCDLKSLALAITCIPKNCIR